LAIFADAQEFEAVGSMASRLRVRRTVEEKLAIAREAGEKGVSQTARRHGIERQRIYQWRSDLRDLLEAQEQSVTFAQVELAEEPAPASSSQAMIEIGLIGGRVLRAPVDIPAANLRALIQIVEAA
jgi:transposase